jgi:5'(3')-deoxyribonucleotidase
MQAIPSSRNRDLPTPYLAYCQQFTEPTIPERNINMYSIRRLFRSNGQRRGEILEVSSFVRNIQLIPKFGQSIGDNMDQHNSLEIANDFYINAFFNKSVYRSVF